MKIIKLFDRNHLRSSFLTFVVRKLLKRPFVFPDRNGFQFVILPEEHIFTLFYNGYLGYPEIGEQEFCKKVLKPGMTVFDVGANIGQFTMLFASLVGSSGKVVSFEPSDSTLRRLKANIALNGFNNIIVERAAANDRHGGMLNINIFPEGYSVWNTIGSPKMYSRDDPGRKIEPVRQEAVVSVRLDEYCRAQGIKSIDYLKIDVEGAELEALSGCSEMLRNGSIRYVQFEISQAMIEGMKRESSEVFRFLMDLGYTCYPITSAGTMGKPTEGTKEFFANFIAMR